MSRSLAAARLAPWWPVLPALMAVVLSLPCVGFAFISDDYNFLQRAAHFRLDQLVPDEHSAFYRPISRELYFALLNGIAPGNSLVAHAGNALLLGIAIALVAKLAGRLGGVRFGLFTGLFLAALGSLPLLVGWVSCSQDLFAMIFVAAALLTASSGRVWVSASLTALGLLSKETTLFFVPAILYLATRGAAGFPALRPRLLPFGILFGLWAAIHPKIQAFFLHGFATGEGGYVGVDNPYIGRNALRMAETFVNVPPTGIHTPWPEWVTGALLVGLLVLGIVAWAGRGGARPDPPRASDRTILRTAVLTGILPAILTVASAKHWFPYYACLPAIGTSMLLALPLRRSRWPVGMAVIGVFLVLGAWYRGTDAGKTTLPAEANFRAASLCYQRVDAGIHRLRPQFPESARVYFTIEASLDTGLHGHLLHGQVLRTWYRNESITSLPAEYQERGPWPEYLFWVNPACEVFEITVPDLRVRSGGPRPNYISYQKTLRSYALGAWASGDADRGVMLLQGMQEVDHRSWEFDRRLAAMLLFASGRVGEAERLLRGLPPLSREDALGAVSAALTPELPRPGMDDAAFRAFGLSTGDVGAYSDLMFYFSEKVLLRKAKRMAERVLALEPADEDARTMLDAIAKVPKWEAVMVPAEGWGERFEQAY